MREREKNEVPVNISFDSLPSVQFLQHFSFTFSFDPSFFSVCMFLLFSNFEYFHRPVIILIKNHRATKPSRAEPLIPIYRSGTTHRSSLPTSPCVKHLVIGNADRISFIVYRGKKFGSLGINFTFGGFEYAHIFVLYCCMKLVC